MKILNKINKVYPVRSQSSKMTASSNGGFTLIEILVVIGILIVILAFGMTVNFGAFTNSTIQSEEAKIVSVLERARSHAMANMFESKYGVCYDSASKSYVIFQGVNCIVSSTSELILANTNIAENLGTTWSVTPVVFNQLAGTTTSASLITIIVTDGVKSLPITINNEGTINW